MSDDYRSKVPDPDFSCQYDFTPRPDKDVEAALRGDFDNPAEPGAGAPGGSLWMPTGFVKLR